MPRVFDRRILLPSLAAMLVLAPSYFWIGRFLGTGTALPLEFLFLAITIIVLLVCYEIYFVTQAKNLRRRAHVVRSGLDERIPFAVRWVWIYGAVYYVFLGLPLALFTNLTQLLKFLAGGLAIFLAASLVFLLWPTTCPPEWRRFERTGVAGRFLALIQDFDTGLNCFPSLHCALSAYAATFLPSPTLRIVPPVLVCMSCVFVKQHSVLDFPLGLFLGLVIGAIVNHWI